MEPTQVDSSADMRTLVTDWLNSKNRNLSEGLDLLEKTGYKPHVCAIFKQNSTRQDIPKKLVNEMFNFLRYHATPKDEVHEDGPELDGNGDNSDQFLSNIEKELAIEFYPPIIKKLLNEFHGLYQQRSLLHKGLKEVGEDNDLKSTTERKRILFVTDAISRRMDQLWQSMEKYKITGELPSEELFDSPFDPDNVIIPADENTNGNTKKTELVLAADVEGLKKQSDNWRIKLCKAQNRLDFQSDKKEDKPNPMPEGPKRIIVMKRIDQLKAEKEVIDLALANAK